MANALPRSYGTRNSSLALISFREAGLAGVGSQVRHGLQLQSLWTIPTAAVSWHRTTYVRQRHAYSCNPYGEPRLQL